MFFVYNVLLYLLVIAFWPVILIAFWIKPKFRAGFFEKIGGYSEIKTEKTGTIWVHAVSVGEVNAVESFVKQLNVNFQDYNIVVSTVTRTGQEVAKNKLAKYTEKIVYFPYDFPFSINKALDLINPDAVIIAETEIWPNFTNEVSKRHVPLVIVNGRISPNSYKGYKKISLFFKEILSKYASILVQTQGDADRIVAIGAPQIITKVMGNLKFDIKNKLEKTEIETISEELKSGEYKVLIAGSTHNGEDEVILDVYEKLKNEFNELKLLIAPRHPERNQNVYELLKKYTGKIGLRSNKDNFEDKDIIMLDTMGELGKLYSICNIAFIGGSFSGSGGHNPLEAAIYNKPTVSGPTVFNFKDIYSYMTQSKASFVVENKDKLYNKIKELLSNKISYQQSSEACKLVFEQHSGALNFTIKEIKEILGYAK